MKLMLMLVGGSVLIFIGIFAVFHEAGLGTFDLPTLCRPAVTARSTRTSRSRSSRFFVIGCGVLAGLWPFHTWSPDGHVSAPTAVSMLHAGVLMKLGAFGIIRLGIQLLPEGAEFWMPGLMVLGVDQRRLRRDRGDRAARLQVHDRLLARSATWATCSWASRRMNPIGVTGAVLQMFAHGVMTALIFAMVGAVYDQAHTRDMPRLRRARERDAAVGRLLHASPGSRHSGCRGSPASSPSSTSSSACSARTRWSAALGDLRRGAHGGLHPAHVRDVVLRAVQRRAGTACKDLTPLERDGRRAAASASSLFMGLWPAPFIDRISATVDAAAGRSTG